MGCNARVSCRAHENLLITEVSNKIMIADCNTCGFHLRLCRIWKCRSQQGILLNFTILSQLKYFLVLNPYELYLSNEHPLRFGPFGLRYSQHIWEKTFCIFWDSMLDPCLKVIRQHNFRFHVYHAISIREHLVLYKPTINVIPGKDLKCSSIAISLSSPMASWELISIFIAIYSLV